MKTSKQTLQELVEFLKNEKKFKAQYELSLDDLLKNSIFDDSKKDDKVDEEQIELEAQVFFADDGLIRTLRLSMTFII